VEELAEELAIVKNVDPVVDVVLSAIVDTNAQEIVI
jgi:hypothetical protein